MRVKQIIYPILAGFFGFAATAVGAHFFSLQHPYWYIGIGIVFFLLANNFLYKLKFNSYQVNGSTVTTVLVFSSQVCCTGLYRFEEVGVKWLLGVFLILLGTILIEDEKEKP